MRGDGNVYQRGPMWWVRITRDGVEHREPGGPTEAKAKARLQALRDELARGSYLAPVERQATVNDLLDELLQHLEVKGIASVRTVGSHMKALRAAFGDLRASSLTTAAVERYQQDRRKAGRASATINRELEALRQAYRRGYRVKPRRVAEVPDIPLLTVSNARQGFLSPAEVAALLEHVEDADLRDFLDWSAWTGMRPNESRQLTWQMLDRSDPKLWTLALDPKAAKIRKGRVLALEGPLLDIIKRRLKVRRLDVPLIFHRTSKGSVGQPIIRYDRAWRAALKAAQLPAGLVPYDLRRSALRNLVRAGVDVSVAMKISGHRTRSTFDRYNIVDVEDVRLALRATAAYVAALPDERKVAGIGEGKANIAENENAQLTHKRA